MASTSCKVSVKFGHPERHLVAFGVILVPRFGKTDCSTKAEAHRATNYSGRFDSFEAGLSVGKFEITYSRQQ
jgi:hypothetical protein